MNQLPPLLTKNPPPKTTGLPTWAVVSLAAGIAVFGFVFLVGLLAAIAIPNFAKARQTAQMNACINNLRMIEGAKQQWALENKKVPTDTPTQDEVAAQLRDHQLPVCPAGGVYSLKSVGEEPTCSIPKHSLSDHSATSHY